MVPETVQGPARGRAGEPQWGGLCQRADMLMGRYDDVLAELADAGRGTIDQHRRIALLAAAFRELRGEFERITCDEAYVDEVELRAEQRGFERGRAAERAAADRRRPARPLQPAGNVRELRPSVRPVSAVAVAGTAVHVLARHKVLATAAAGLVVAGGAGIASRGMHLAPYTGPAATRVVAPAGVLPVAATRIPATAPPVAVPAPPVTLNSVRMTPAPRKRPAPATATTATTAPSPTAPASAPADAEATSSPAASVPDDASTQDARPRHRHRHRRLQDGNAAAAPAGQQGGGTPAMAGQQASHRGRHRHHHGAA